MEKKTKISIDQEHNLPEGSFHLLLQSIQIKNTDLFQRVFQQFDVKGLIKFRDYRGASLLHRAAIHDNEYVVKYLIELGFHVDVQDAHGITALMIALKKDHFGSAKVLLQSNADVRLCDTLGNCALQIAIAVDPTTSVNLEPTRLPLSCWLSRYWKVVSLIVKRINEDYSFDSNKIAERLLQIRCPLSHVVFMGNCKVMKIMIDKGSPINVRDRYWGRTALHLAAEYWKLDEIKVLLNFGADLNVCDHYVRTPCMCIYDNIKYMQTSPLREVEIVKALLEHKHKIFVTNDHGLGALDQMSQVFRKGSVDAVRVVIMESDDDLFLAKNKDQITLLHLLAENSNPGIKELIKGRKIDVNAESIYGETALGHAIEHDNYEMIEYLLSEGASTNFENCDQDSSQRSYMVFTPCVKSREVERVIPCVRLLLERGMDQEVLDRNDFTTRSMLDLTLNNETFLTIQPILAQFAIRKSLEVLIPESMSEQIQSYHPAKTHVDSCVKQLDQAKTSKVFKSMTVFELLTASDMIISRFARDKNLVLHLSKSIDQWNFLDPYYVELIRKCILKMSSIAEWRVKAEEIISQIIGKFYEYNSIRDRP